jgi:hypothetical protein
MCLKILLLQFYFWGVKEFNLNIFNCNLYCSPSIIKSDQVTEGEMGRACSTNGAKMILVGKLEGNRPLGRPRRRWVDNIKMDLRLAGVVWTGFIWLRIGTNGGLLWTQ